MSVLMGVRMSVLAWALAVPGCGAPSAEEPIAPAGEAQIAPLAPTNESFLAPTEKFDSSRAWAHLEAQVAIGPRPSGSPEIVRTRQYIAAQLKAAGLQAREQAFTAQTPNGPIEMVNLIATIPGRRAERLVIGTHYDTKLFREIRFVGASDAASSTAVVLELGRVLKDAQPEYTIELLFLDGEEAVVDWYTNNDNTYGSRHYVQAAREDGSLAGVKAFILLDMVGDKDLRISRDSNSTPWLVDIVWEAAARIGHRARFPDSLTTIDDDHIPFVRAGIPSVDIIDLDYPAWHTANDTLDAVSAGSLQIVGDVVLEALPEIQRQLSAGR